MLAEIESISKQFSLMRSEKYIEIASHMPYYYYIM